jgi:hypothetical protein
VHLEYLCHFFSCIESHITILFPDVLYSYVWIY